MANDEEEQIALTSRDEDSYRTITGQRVMKLRKMELTAMERTRPRALEADTGQEHTR